MARREFLQLAKTYRPDRDKIAGFCVSEKLDGTRCFWDGGVSRGLPTVDVPWASVTDPKTGGLKSKIKPCATGLWSRYGNPIMAPDWFLDKLPACPLDGELWAGRGRFQLCRSICGGDKPDSRFSEIRYAIYSSPPLPCVFRDGEIKNSNFHCTIDHESVAVWLNSHVPARFSAFTELAAFAEELHFLQRKLRGVDAQHAFLHEQVQLPGDEDAAREQAEAFLQKVLDEGGEGVVIRNPRGKWTPKRVAELLKYKPFSDAEATITGFTSGRKTNKGSRHLGCIGALITDFNGKRLELSGLTDAERVFAVDSMREHAAKHPGQDMPPEFEGLYFKVGQTVTFKYRELSDDGIPKEARYWRRRDVE